MNPRLLVAGVLVWLVLCLAFTAWLARPRHRRTRPRYVTTPERRTSSSRCVGHLWWSR